MQTSIEQMGQQYPDVAEQLQQLPEHLAEHVGEIALRLSHVDMHPAETVKDGYGQEFQKIDFSHVIIDPEYDASELDAQTVEAAHAGQEKLSKVLGATSGLLAAVHKSISEKGFRFGSEEPETDEDREKREQQERDAVYGEAQDLAVESALKAKAEGKLDDSTQILESLVLLSHMNPDKSRPLFRRVVKEGLAESLLKAGQESAKLFAGSDYDSVADSLRESRPLLEFATGNKLNYEFQPERQLDLGSSEQLMFEDQQDLLAVVTMPSSPIKLEQALGYIRHSTPVERVKERMASQPNEDMEKILGGLTEIEEAEDFNEALKYADPVQAYQAAEKVGIELWEVQGLFGKPAEFGQLVDIDSERIEGMLELKGAFPKYFDQLKNTLMQRSVQTAPYDPRQILEGLQNLQAAGCDDPIFFAGLCEQITVPNYVETCKEIASQLQARGMTLDQLGELVVKGDQIDVFNFVFTCMEEEDVAGNVEQLVANVEILDVYLEAYSKIIYPMTSFKEAIASPELADLPSIERRMQQLGLSSEMASAMFASWATYDAFTDHHYSNRDGFKLPSEAPNQRMLESIARRQAEALENQLHSLESYASAYGMESMNQVITNFGIYNFNKHSPEDLFEQNERWLQGEPVRTAVVDSRYDWNSFTGKEPVFEETTGEGVFMFEANSGTEVAKIAVRLGQRERQLGREPNVKRFILHAHGNPEKMVLGVNREEINTSSYLQAARGRAKIDGAEINDYKKHLGQNFEVVLQSCSTAGETAGQNIAQTISEQHDVKVIGSRISVHGLTIFSDGTVEFATDEADNRPVVYDN